MTTKFQGSPRINRKEVSWNGVAGGEAWGWKHPNVAAAKTNVQDLLLGVSPQWGGGGANILKAPWGFQWTPAITIENSVLTDIGEEMYTFNTNSRCTWIPTSCLEDMLSVCSSKCHKPGAPVTFQREKYLIKFTVSEILVHGWPVLSFWGQKIKAVSHFTAIKSSEKDQGPTIFFKYWPHDPACSL